MHRKSIHSLAKKRNYLPIAFQKNWVLLFSMAVSAYLLIRERGAYGKVILFGFMLLCFSAVYVLSRRAAFSSVVSNLICVLIIAVAQTKQRLFGGNLTFFDVTLLDWQGLSFILRAQAADILPIIAGVAVAVGLVIWLLIKEVPRGTRILGIAGIIVGGALLSAFSNVYGPDRQGLPGFQIASAYPRYEVSFFVRTVANSGNTLWRLWNGDILEKEPGLTLQDINDGSHCTASNAPNIILILDESSFPIGRLPGVRVPDALNSYYRSFDGSSRAFGVEAFGAPTLFAETSVLTGLSSRSFGELKNLMPRYASNNLKYSLTKRLIECGYNTSTIYPLDSGFANAKIMYSSLGFDEFHDKNDIKAPDRMRDKFYYDSAIANMKKRMLLHSGPQFTYILTMENHFPWLPSLFKTHDSHRGEWSENPEVQEYIERQLQSLDDFSSFKHRLADEFTSTPFLIVRFGDHQPYLARKLWEPGASEVTLSNHISKFQEPYFSTYYAVDTVNFIPKTKLPDARKLEAPFLGPLIASLAGLPLDSLQAHYMANVEKCQGLYFECQNGAFARQVSGALSRAGMINGL
ncbi:sulfatase-like hydrolase/transferase [Labrys neptuniae]